MAIVFVSPKKKILKISIAIVGFFAIGVIIITLFVFLVRPKPASEEVVFLKPNINIDFSVLDSEELAKLVLLNNIEFKFDYEAEDKDNKKVFGSVYAQSIDLAKQSLEKNGLKIIKLEKEILGRDNPFTSYYQEASTEKNIKK